jgi:hypothetical protein
VADVLVRTIYNHAAKTLRRPTVYTAGGPYNLFQIAGGCINVKALYGICITASTGNVLQLLGFTPTLGVAGLQALGVQAAAAVTTIGSLVAWAGTLITTWTRTAVGWGDPTTANMSFLGNNINFSPGIIQESAALADVSLVMDWYIVYVPGGPGVTVTPL